MDDSEVSKLNLKIKKDVWLSILWMETPGILELLTKYEIYWT
jgi:hypothetical protein